MLLFSFNHFADHLYRQQLVLKQQVHLQFPYRSPFLKEAVKVK